MPVAFGSGADFGGMVEGDDAGLWISEVFHEAFVGVDEKGTEAAAATAVEVVESIPPEWGTVRFDRPFLFCIRDRPTDAVLFLGRVADAGSAQPQR
jgi:serpin B